MRSTPFVFNILDNSIDSSTVHPPSAQSVAEMRKKRGNSSFHTSLTALVVSITNLILLLNVPPYSSLR
jgi:hypothetical protein